MVDVRSFSELTKKDVFTDKGIYCGRITDMDFDLEKFRVRSLVIDAIKGSFFASLVGDKKGVIVPFAMVQSIGDVIIIKHIMPVAEEPEEEIKA
jgi:sporulation protein YlmC with PRC-barrel domain